MGLLDDAIREHLELKRRRGADSGEITRQEQEAFGAARRGETEPALDAPGEFAAEAAPTALHVVEDHHHEESDPPRPHGDPADQLPHVEPAEAHEDHHEHDHEHDHEIADEPRGHGDPADSLPHVEAAPVQEHRVVEPEPGPPAAPPAPAEPPASVSQPTREFDLDEVRAATGEESAPRAEEDDEEGEEGDVLEETPEFLQETPEHDRLWFEQRPPRDFDF